MTWYIHTFLSISFKPIVFILKKKIMDMKTDKIQSFHLSIYKEIHMIRLSLGATLVAATLFSNAAIAGFYPIGIATFW